MTVHRDQHDQAALAYSKLVTSRTGPTVYVGHESTITLASTKPTNRSGESSARQTGRCVTLAL